MAGRTMDAVAVHVWVQPSLGCLAQNNLSRPLRLRRHTDYAYLHLRMPDLCGNISIWLDHPIVLFGEMTMANDAESAVTIGKKVSDVSVD